MKNRTGVFCLRVILVGLISVSFQNAFAGRPVALIYNGPGACKSDGHCAEAAAAVADKAGYEVEFVGAKTKDASLFDEAALYIQPGGNATQVADNMLVSMKNLVRDFVHNGGGYVGFCAGAFYAMTPYDDAGQNRLGLLDGDAEVADFNYPSIVSVSWLDGIRHHVYWEGGAYFKSLGSDIEVVSRYADTRQVSSVRGKSGKGRVWVTGFHPEAPYDWRFDPKLEDPDGTEPDQAMAVEMIRWVANPPSR